MAPLDVCKLGIEGFSRKFAADMLNKGTCLGMDNPRIDITSDALIQYNNTLCTLASECNKIGLLAGDFLTCIKVSFCNNAPEAVKETARHVYELNKEMFYEQAKHALPWLGAAFAVGALGSYFLPKSKMTPVFQLTTGLSVLTAALFLKKAYT